jgi:hypothetical protein
MAFCEPTGPRIEGTDNFLAGLGWNSNDGGAGISALG